MLVRCPQCKDEFRLVDYPTDERVVRYLCPLCSEIVLIDLELDEVQSSSSAGSYRSLERKQTVLVADDSRPVLDLAETLLQQAGFQVLLAADGLEALDTIRRHHPDLVMLDLLMPRMTGFDVLRELRQDERIRETPVLVMSGVYKDNILGFLSDLGARGFLDKEHLEDTLVFRARQILNPERPS